MYHHTHDELIAVAELLAPRPGETLMDLHNRIAGPIAVAIIRPTVQAGGDYKSALVLLESVIVGTIMAVAKLGGDEPMLDLVVTAAKRRLAEARLGGLPVAGTG